MMGRNIEKRLQELVSADAARQRHVAGALLKTSERYFDEKKVSPENRQLIIETLSPLVAHEDVQVRRCVAYLVAILRKWSETTRQMLRALLCDQEPTVQAAAVWASGKLENAASALVDVLLGLAEHADREVRWRVPWALGEIRSYNEDVKLSLVRLTRDPDDTARLYAFKALSACAPEADSDIVAAVRSGLTDKEKPSPVGACGVVRKLPGDWSQVRKDLDAVFATGLHGLQAEAVLAICHCWPERVVSPEINSWLRENQGYWWAADLLEGKTV